MADVNQEWLQSLKVGDEVAVYHSGSFYGRYEFAKIARASAKFFTVGATRYRREDGREAGNRYRSILEEPTAQLKAQEAEKNRRRVLVRALDDTNWERLPLPILEGVYSLLPQTNQQTERS